MITLTAIAQSEPVGAVSREQLTVLTGYKRSTRDKFLQLLRGKGLIEDGANGITTTDGGLNSLPADFEPLPTGRALQEWWLGRLPEGERRILEMLCSSYPKAADRDAISDGTGYARSSRDKFLQYLAAKKLTTNIGRGQVKAADLLF